MMDRAPERATERLVRQRREEPLVAGEYVRVGGYGGGRGGGGLVPCYVRVSGGVEGDEDTACTWVYDLYRRPGDATPFAVDVPFVGQRMALGAYTPAANDTLGIAYYDRHGDPPAWVLIACGEAEVPDPCSEAPPEEEE